MQLHGQDASPTHGHSPDQAVSDCGHHQHQATLLAACQLGPPPMLDLCRLAEWNQDQALFISNKRALQERLEQGALTTAVASNLLTVIGLGDPEQVHQQS
jgi:hypothetical protein